MQATGSTHSTKSLMVKTKYPVPWKTARYQVSVQLEESSVNKQAMCVVLYGPTSRRRQPHTIHTEANVSGGKPHRHPAANS